MKDGRLCSLDVLRGMDMFLLTVVGPFVFALHASVGLPESVLSEFRHSWVGFSLWDIIMPMFIFMSGAAVPFAMRRRLSDGCAGWPYWRHVLVRFAVLWFLGLITQGRLLSLDIMQISPFDNTLQSIAVGYLFSALAFLMPSRRLRIMFPIFLAAGYSILLHLFGDYTLEGNFAQRVENVVVTFLVPAGSRVLALADPGYTWWLTSMMFGAMSLCGMEAAQILAEEGARMRNFWRLVMLGCALLATGFVAAIWIPVIKPIYTLSFTAQAMGWCCLALAVLYLVTDVLAFRRGLGIFILFGQTALLAYMVVEAFGGTLNAFADIVTQGVAAQFGNSRVPVMKWIASSLLLVALLYFRRQAARREIKL